MELLKIKLDGKKYTIYCDKTENVLTFTDATNALIGFVKHNPENSGFSIFINDVYRKTDSRFPNTEGMNSYALSPEQIKILIEWYEK